jgi:hypothetical protein
MSLRPLEALLATLATGLLFLAGCAPRADSAELRSPSHDYPAPPRTTADGEVLGADRKPVTDAIDSTRPPERKPEPGK